MRTFLAWCALTALATPVHAATAPAAPAPLSVTVAATGDLTCQAYFHNRAGRLHGPLVVSLKGTGVYTTANSAKVELAVRQLYEEGRVTVLTLDKPGVFAQRGVAVVDDGLFNRYVQDDLVRCTTNALDFAATRMNDGGLVVFSGHSEGAQVAIRVLTALATAQHPLTSRVKALFLSGLPLGDWRSLLGAQLRQRDRQRFFLAFERRDDAVLRSFGNLSAAYLGHVFAQEPLDATLDRLASLGVDADLRVYQGLADRHTPAAAVRAYVARNQERGGLRLTARYYPAGHALSRVAVLDIARDIATTVGENGLFD